MTDAIVSPPWPDQLGKGETQKRLLTMKVSELRAIAEHEGIKTGPTKGDTVDRIMALWFDKAKPDFPPAAGRPTGQAAAPVPPPADAPTPMGKVVYPTPGPVSAEGISAAPVAPPPPPVPSVSPTLVDIIKPEVALRPPFSVAFDRRAIKKALRGMNMDGIRAIADFEGIEHSSDRAILDKYEIIVLILDAWQHRVMDQVSKGKPPVVVQPSAALPSPAPAVTEAGVSGPAPVAVSPAPSEEQVRVPVVEAPPPAIAAPGEREADNSWPLELGRVETLKRLRAMKVTELTAIAENEGVEVGPKKSDTIDRILKAWFVHRTATRYQGRARPEEPPPGVSARAQRIRESQASR